MLRKQIEEGNTNTSTAKNLSPVSMTGVDDLNPSASGTKPAVKSDVTKSATPVQPTVSSKINAAMKQFENNPKLLAEYTSTAMKAGSNSKLRNELVLNIKRDTGLTANEAFQVFKLLQGMGQ
jgi:hypothetical protein